MLGLAPAPRSAHRGATHATVTGDAMKQLFGLLTFLFAAAVLLWVGYNVLIERQPEFKGPTLLVTMAMISLGSWDIALMKGD
jgi:hypothetical protein